MESKIIDNCKTIVENSDAIHQIRKSVDHYETKTLVESDLKDLKKRIKEDQKVDEWKEKNYGEQVFLIIPKLRIIISGAGVISLDLDIST